MQSLSFRNYDQVYVYVRGMDTPIAMPGATGMKLMEFLTTDTAGTSHVMLTDTEGLQTVVNRREILRVEPREKNIKVYMEFES